MAAVMAMPIMFFLFFASSPFCDRAVASLLQSQEHLQMVTSEEFRLVVDHPVLFKMPGLSVAEEKQILDGLYALKDEFEGVYTLSTGRLLREVDDCTHAIFVRLPSEDALEKYYNSAPLKKIALEMRPYNHGEYTVDYPTYVENNHKSIYRVGEEFYYGIEHLVFLRVKEGTTEGTIKDLVSLAYQLVNQIDYVVQVTAGANNYLRSKTFSHAIVVHIQSEDLLDSFYKNPAYIKLWKEKIEPITSWTISADYLPYHPAE